MKKKFLIVGTIIALAAAVYFGWALIKNEAPTTPGSDQVPVTSFPDSGVVPVDTTGSTLLVRTESGDVLTVQNFMNNTETFADPSNVGYYYLGNHFSPTHELTKEPPYVIEYISGSQYFNIVLLREPLAATRFEAERYLMNTLGIGEAEMCKLRYTLSVPVKVNEQYAGRDLGFSFCPESVELK